MENINFRGIPTSLFLNGPKLGIVTDPQSVNAVGFATFTGIATATFPDNNFDFDGGSIAFKWYFDGSQKLDITEDLNSNASIVGFSSATGTGSTITINGLTSDDVGKEVYFEVDYVPSAYQTTSPVTAGTARSTGNAFNEPLRSGIATVDISPIIEITQQPEDKVIGQTFAAEYSIAARKTPGGGTVNYQWQLNGNDLSDGTTTTTVNETSTGQIVFVPVHPDTQEVQAGGDTIDFSQVSSYDFGEKGFGTQDLRLTANADITVKLYLVGAGGGTSKYNSARGGAGGLAEGTFTFLKDQHYMLRVGGNGAGLSLRKRTGGGDGTGNGSEGGGGGYTGLFIGSSTPDYNQANAIIMAGGGGGGASDPATGGVGGGSEGGDSSNADSNNRGGRGGTQTAGGAGGSAPGESGRQGDPGSALQGGNGPAGGGGGGYFGGGGGFGNVVVGADGGGGGGSGFMHSTLITDGVLTQGEGTVEEGVNGSFRIEIVSTAKTVTTTVTGATTPNLSITTDDEASGVVRCKLTADGVQKSPVFSRSVSYYVVGIRNLVKIEQYDYANGTATLTSHNLSDGSLSLSYDSHPGNAICLYAGEQDVDVEMDLYGGKGPTATAGINADGGDGGYSKIIFTMKKDEEYILTGLFSAVNAPFLYRKGTLIACVGAGGAGAPSGGNAGGQGGGIGIAGEEGRNNGGGSGGRAITAGTGNVRAQFGSAFDGAALTGGLVSNDGQRTGTQGGDGASCTRGVYWRQQGKAPCEDLGTIKFRTPNGTEISNTAEISRGYKSGYNAIQTGGAGLNDKSGDGGCGYAGGFGGDNRGGGGGSGYTDGSVTVVKTQLGGSTGPARININLSAGNFFIDDQGRILIYASTDARDPETGITKTTGVVNYGDNACIDDARWQRFLDLSRDGTQDYRLTATENNSTVKITNATEKNIHKMMNANQHPLSTSLTDWYNKSYSYDLRMLAWDETTGATVSGSDYSMLSWSPASAYGYGFYGSSSVPFFNPTVYGYKTGINFWILPPGVPDF